YTPRKAYGGNELAHLRFPFPHIPGPRHEVRWRNAKHMPAVFRKSQPINNLMNHRTLSHARRTQQGNRAYGSLMKKFEDGLARFVDKMSPRERSILGKRCKVGSKPGQHGSIHH